MGAPGILELATVLVIIAVPVAIIWLIVKMVQKDI